MREKLREMTEQHYEAWISEPIPALGGRTPLEAVQDRVGREKVEALITDIERQSPEADRDVFGRVRERLGLGASQ